MSRAGLGAEGMCTVRDDDDESMEFEGEGGDEGDNMHGTHHALGAKALMLTSNSDPQFPLALAARAQGAPTLLTRKQSRWHRS